ncbi:nucleotide exchange factor GrpE [Candidatus Sumerlaeota bacterium]|nr:nucleotide exchange factor GrpE [Candidatus Sumerlaeota bacterium]
MKPPKTPANQDLHDSDHQIPVTEEEAEEKMEDEGGGVHPALGAPAVEASESTQDQLRRLRADFDNYRKRTAKEFNTQRQRGRRDAIESLLNVYDGLSMGLMRMPKDNPWRAGLEAIQLQFIGAFESLGVKRVKTVGQPFDPNQHEAIGNIASTHAEGIVCEETRTGFYDETGLVRAPQVLVSTGKK